MGGVQIKEGERKGKSGAQAGRREGSPPLLPWPTPGGKGPSPRAHRGQAQGGERGRALTPQGTGPLLSDQGGGGERGPGKGRSPTRTQGPPLLEGRRAPPGRRAHEEGGRKRGKRKSPRASLMLRPCLTFSLTETSPACGSTEPHLTDVYRTTEGKATGRDPPPPLPPLELSPLRVAGVRERKGESNKPILTKELETR